VQIQCSEVDLGHTMASMLAELIVAATQING